MSIQSDIYAALGQYAGLSAMIGARIYWDVADQEASAPYVVLQEISVVPQNGLDGHNSLDLDRIQATSWARSRTQARMVNEQVRAAMAGSATLNSICIDVRSLGFEPETKLYGIQADFSVPERT